MREKTPQYFPAEPDLRTPLSKGFDKHVFLDLGAYNGDSIHGFLDYVDNEYSGIIAVEISENNYKVLKEKCKDLHDTECINLGVSDRKKTMSFSISDVKNSFASADGNSLIEVDSVDNILKDKRVSFIKMDIEGEEYECIKGAKNTIQRDKPIMAISVYHKIEDLYLLALEVEKIVPNTYDYYLRHYSPTIIETILYAVPHSL